MERLEKNFLWMAAANVAASIFSIALFIYLARALRVEAFGSLSYAYSFIFYLMNFVDLGLSTYGIREVAKDRARASEYVSEIVSFKLLLAAILFVLILILAFLTCPSAQFRFLMAGASLVLFIAAFSTDWAFQGQEKTHLVFVSLVVTTFLQFVSIYIFVKVPGDLLKAPVVYFLAALPITVLFLLHFKYRPKLKTSYLRQIRKYLASSIVIWSIAMLAQIYNGLDIVLLGIFRRAEEVGFFTIARRAIGGASLLMIFLANALLPRLSSTFGRDAEQFHRATHKFLKISVFLTVFVILPAILFSSHLISFVLGDEYLPASVPFKIMTLGFVLVVFNLPYSTGLVAAGFEKDVLKQVLASAVLSVISNMFLMPRYGMVGASISFLLAEALALVWVLRAYHKKIGISARLSFSK